jgi:hypothetical protein
MNGIYREHAEIKQRMKRAGVGYKDVAAWLKMPPSTIAGKLCGWTPLRDTERVVIEVRLSELERSGADAAQSPEG